MGSLLPPATTPLERAAVEACAFDIPVYLADLYNPATCPTHILPWLAWAWHVTDEEGWLLADNVEKQRALLAESHELHRRKGTRWAVLTALARAGFPGCDIIEHKDIISRWLQAGGELLDGGGTLDGSDTIAPPNADFRFMTTHWAENIIRVNFADADWSRASQRKILDVAQEWAPLRSAFVALVAIAAWTWQSPITFSGTQTIRTVMDGCQRHPVARFDTLDGCDLIGGDNLPSYLTGDEALDGLGTISGTVTGGEPLDGGSMGYALRLKHLAGFTVGGDRIEAPDTLGSDDRLDGTAIIAGEILDGRGRLNGGNLWYPALYHPDATLDGVGNLGVIPGPDTVWFNGTVRIRNGTTITQESL